MSPSGIPYFKAWLIFVLVSAVCGFLAGAFAGFIVGAVMGVAGMEVEQIKLIGSVLGFILGLAASFLTFRWVIDRFVVPAVTSPQGSDL